MPEITNPQVIKFANERIRSIANIVYNAYWQSKSIIEDYNAGDIGTKINDEGSGNLVADGSAVDGRTRITGGDIFNVITALGEFIDYYEGGTVTQADRTDVFSKPHVHNS